MTKNVEQMSRPQLLAEIRLLNDLRQRDVLIALMQGIFTTIKLLIQYGVLVLIGFFSWRTSEALAGKITLADIGINVDLLGGLKLNVATSWAAAFAFGSLWVRERNLRKAVTAKLSEDKARLERQLDAKRTSSMLEPHGDNPPGEAQ